METKLQQSISVTGSISIPEILFTEILSFKLRIGSPIQFKIRTHLGWKSFGPWMFSNSRAIFSLSEVSCISSRIGLSVLTHYLSQTSVFFQN